MVSVLSALFLGGVSSVALAASGWEITGKGNGDRWTLKLCGKSQYGVYGFREVNSQGMVTLARAPLLADHKPHNVQFRSAHGGQWSHWSSSQRQAYVKGVNSLAYKVVALKNNVMTLRLYESGQLIQSGKEHLHSVRC